MIYNEDCLVTMGRMLDNSIDLVVTSPPYNMRLRVRNGEYAKRERGEDFVNKYQHFDDALPIDEFYTFHKKVIAELLRVSTIVCYNFQIVTGSKEAFFKLMGDYNISIKDVIIWCKGTGEPAMHENIMNSVYEMILVMEGDNIKGRMIQNAKFKRGTFNNVLHIGRPREYNKDHKAVFPEELVRQLIYAFSEEGQTVYDPFAGTGTVPAVAKRLNRKYIASELSKEYCDTIEHRLDFKEISLL